MNFFILKLLDYTKYPFSRYRKDGGNSAEEFRCDHLIPALEQHQLIVLDLNGVIGFPTSWTEEVFGGLVREHGFTTNELRERLSIDVKDKLIEYEIWDLIERSEKTR
ncbi:STAS-like domain-containing protein [Pseudomonas sp. CBZ-4]|uniref:STAS-like domain-containing protein n=1 Tax=Pseudomonas sp. CBZ-4 TaxID=1163065 RepID=UPI0009DA2E57|nr:STAS-like domain-containing protein [Pseudomonas sp. CBZ-4]